MKKVLFLLLSMTIYSCFESHNSKDILKKTTYKGIVVRKYIDESNHGQTTGIVRQEDSDKYIMFHDWVGSWDYVNVGDSIIKKADTLMITIKKQNLSSKDFFYR